jgi:hypothetical protein
MRSRLSTRLTDDQSARKAVGYAHHRAHARGPRGACSAVRRQRVADHSGYPGGRSHKTSRSAMVSALSRKLIGLATPATCAPRRAAGFPAKWDKETLRRRAAFSGGLFQGGPVNVVCRIAGRPAVNVVRRMQPGGLRSLSPLVRRSARPLSERQRDGHCSFAYFIGEHGIFNRARQHHTANA